MRKGRAGKLYVDGVLVASGESPLGSRTLVTTTRFYWGGLPDHLVVEDEDVNVSDGDINKFALNANDVLKIK